MAVFAIWRRGDSIATIVVWMPHSTIAM